MFVKHKFKFSDAGRRFTCRHYPVINVTLSSVVMGWADFGLEHGSGNAALKALQ